MKTARSEALTLIPLPAGWQLWHGHEPGPTAATLEEIGVLLPSVGTLQLVVPNHLLVIERLHLPATQRDELAGMVELQWEKALPFSIEEIAGDFLVVLSGEKESTVLTVAVPNAALDRLRQPLEKHARRIVQVTPSFELLAAGAPETQTVLLVAAEDEHWVMMIVENRRPAWVHVLPRQDAARFATILPQILLTASMEGVPAQFSQILVTEEAAELSPILQEFFELPPIPLAPPRPLRSPVFNLLPPSWAAETHRRGSTARLGRQVGLAAGLYLLAVLGIAIYLAILGRKSRQLDQELASVQPQLALIQARQARSASLAPAIDPHRYTVEILYLLNRLLPGEGLQLTEFDHSPAQWRVVGEAASARTAIDYLTRIKEDPDLKAYNISAGPPRLLPNDRAQFSIFGKP